MMKKICNIIALLFCVIVLHAQTVDRSIRPSAAPAKEIEIKDAQTFTLSNGLKVFVVEDHRAPIVYYSLQLDIKPALEGDKAGMRDLFTEVIGTATQTRTKEQLNKEIDMIGARINASSRGGSASGLKKYESKMLELLSDMMLYPVFSQEELNLNKEKARSALELISSDAGGIGSRLSNTLVYGSQYPDGEIETVETIDNVMVADLEHFYHTYFAPNVTRLVIVGSITEAEARANAQKYFGQWTKREVPVSKYVIPQAPPQTKVAMFHKEGAVQSIINLTYPIDYKPGAPDAEAISVAATTLGGGMTGRLFLNLREVHSYTYGAYCRLTEGEQVGLFSLSNGRGSGPSVKAAATDSSLTQVIYEMNNMISTPITEEELKGAKAFLAGYFGRSLMQSATLARYAVYIDKYNLPKDYFKNYLKRIEAVTVADVQAAAKKYFTPENAWIVVVGDKEHADGLKPFAADQTVQFYDFNVNAVAAPQTMTTDLSAEQIINNYVKAIGGVEAIEAVKDFKITASMNAMGQNLEVVRMFKAPHYSLNSMGMSGMVIQKAVFDGVAYKISGMAGNQEFTEGAEFEAAKAETSVCPEMNLLKSGYAVTVKGIENDAYILEVDKGSTKTTYYFDVNTGLLSRQTNVVETPQGVVQQVSEYEDYRLVGGILFPYTVTQKVPSMGVEMKMVVKDIVVNTGLSADEFK
ncbi:MAG: insulinase family protein [Bacteroidales bacterium]|nr:insulinase family protein [Bacteroidales bacterium]